MFEATIDVFWLITVTMLTAFGLAVIFGMLKVMNMAHGEFITIGAYSVVLIDQTGLPWAVGVAVAGIVAALVGLCIERGIVRHFYDRPFDTLLATWGISLVLRELLEIIFGRGYRNVSPPIDGMMPLSFASDAGYPAWRLMVMAIMILAAIIGWLWYRRSRVGLLVAATVENPVLARSLGMSTGKIKTGVFMVGAASGGIAGALLSPGLRIDPLIGLDYLISSFLALVIGGVGSILGFVFGAGFVGLTNGAVAQLAGPTNGYVALLVLAIIVMWRFPSGLIGLLQSRRSQFQLAKINDDD